MSDPFISNGAANFKTPCNFANFNIMLVPKFFIIIKIIEMLFSRNALYIYRQLEQFYYLRVDVVKLKNSAIAPKIYNNR